MCTGAVFAALAPVPSFEHEILLQLFRDRVEIVCEVLRECAGIDLTGNAELATSDLSQVTSTEYRADHVVVLRAADRSPTSAVILEVQLGIDPDKRRTWPVYIASLRATLNCPVVLLVLAPRDPVAHWARKSIETGHPGFVLTPLVVSYESFPRGTDSELARSMPELAVLSAIAHADIGIMHTTLEAISSLPEKTSELYFDLLALTQPEILHQLLSQHMKNAIIPYRSDFARKYYSEGLEDGHKKGLEEGREEGREEGLRVAAIALAQSKVANLAPADEAKIRELHLTSLTDLVFALARAHDEAEARAALTRAFAH